MRVDSMSRPHQATSNSVANFLESLLGDDDGLSSCRNDRYFDSSTEAHMSCSLLSPVKGSCTRWAEWDVVDFVANKYQGNNSPGITPFNNSEVDGAQMHLSRTQKKRKQSEEFQDHEEVSGAARIQSPRDQRQRGKNWEKAEEIILVECKSKRMEWKSISERLQERGFTRNHKHCADKWYALRKHYLEVHQWMADHPTIDYWDRTQPVERVRSVPPSFCQKWYRVFDAAEKREGRKTTKLVSRNLKSDGAIDPSYNRSGSPHRAAAEQRLCAAADVAAVATLNEDGFCRLDGSCFRPGIGAVPDRAYLKQLQPDMNTIRMLATEIQNLRRTLAWKFEAGEKERSRLLAIHEKKLEMKRQRFDYRRIRDEEQQKTSTQCRRHPAVKAS